MSALMLMLALAVAPSPGAADCPPPVMAPPHYPAKQLRDGVSGTTIVLARIDACGRVVEAKVSEGSGQSALDDAALETVRGWVLSQAQREKVGGPWVKMPVRFAGMTTIVPQAPDWPKSHRRPVYLADDQGIGFATIAAFDAANVVRTEPMLKSPYASTYDGSGNRISTPFMADAADGSTFWLSYLMQPPPTRGADGEPRASRTQQVAVARYRLVMEDGKPVVRVGLLCERAADECERLQDFLLKGLPIAKPSR
jgi:TonB family protein